MKRNEIWTVSGSDYTGKPQYAVILQVDGSEYLESVTICPFTTDDRGPEIVRILVRPGSGNGLKVPCKLMADKVTTLPKSRLGKKLGTLDPEDMRRLETAVLTFLGLA